MVKVIFIPPDKLQLDHFQKFNKIPVYSISIIAIIGMLMPVYGQNVSPEEEDLRIKELIAACEKAIDEDDALTTAEKTVAKRNCSTDITNSNTEFDNDHRNLAEYKVKAETIQKCEQWYPQYLMLTEENFRIHKGTEAVTDCILLYNNSIWEYVGEDRVDVLIQALGALKTEIEETPKNIEPESIISEVKEIDDLDHEEAPEESLTNIEKTSEERIVELEEQVNSLQEELTKKDEIIMEQLRVIMDLANKIKDVIFGNLGSFLSQI